MILRDRVISLRSLHFDAFGGFRFRSLISIDSDLIGNVTISITLERYSHVLPSIHIEAVAKVEELLVAYFRTPKGVGSVPWVRTVGKRRD